MRSSQAASWSGATLESYLNDLRCQKLFKEPTHREICSNDEAHALEKIVAIVLEWEKELSEKYLNIIEKGKLGGKSL